jgi:quaternary ammonium compound-resistance protein SugE
VVAAWRSATADPAFGWRVLAAAGVLEVVWLVALKRSDGFAHPLYGAASVIVAWASFFLLSLALRSIPAGTAYAVWTGVGAAGGVIAGIVLFGEARDATRLASLALIVVGILGVQANR